MNQAIVYSCPAYDIVEGKPAPDYRCGCVEIKDGDRLALAYESRNHGTLHHQYKAGSVIAYALRSGDDPIEAYEREKARGHSLHYLIPLGTSITAEKRDRYQMVEIKVGQVVRFEGRFFEIVAERNDNLGLKPAERPIPGAL